MPDQISADLSSLVALPKSGAQPQNPETRKCTGKGLGFPPIIPRHLCDLNSTGKAIRQKYHFVYENGLSSG